MKRADKYSVVPSQSTRFKFNHQPLDLFSASSLSLRDFSDFHHAHTDDSESARSRRAGVRHRARR